MCGVGLWLAIQLEQLDKNNKKNTMGHVTTSINPDNKISNLI